MKGYHYTNSKAYKSMQTNGIEGYISQNYEDFAGLIPNKRFIRFGWGSGLPDEAREGIIEGLLEPEPKSWIENSEFPFLWIPLMRNICRQKEIILLSFEFDSKDRAYVVERAHIERELYKKAKTGKEFTKRSMNKACKKYWESRVPVLDYAGNYDVPQLAIWSGIEFDRLNVEWVKPVDKVWQRVLDNNR